MDPIDALLRLVLLPGAVCAGAALLGALLGRRWPRARHAVLALGLATGFTVALYAYGVRPRLPLAVSDDAWQWVAWLAPASALAGIALAGLRLPAVVAFLVRALLCAGAAWLLLRALVPHALAQGDALLRAGIGGAAAAILWTISERGARAERRIALPAVWLVALTGVAGVLLEYGRSAVMAQAAGALATCVGATATFAWRSKGPLLPPTAAPVLAVVLVGLLVAAHGYLNYGSAVKIPVETAALLAASAACAILRRWPLAVALALAAAGAAAWFAHLRVEAVPSTPW